MNKQILLAGVSAIISVKIREHYQDKTDWQDKDVPGNTDCGLSGILDDIMTVINPDKSVFKNKKLYSYLSDKLADLNEQKHVPSPSEIEKAITDIVSDVPLFVIVSDRQVIKLVDTDEILRSDVRISGKALSETDMVLECGGGDYRLYVTVQGSPGNSGFEAIALGSLGWSGHGPMWECDAQMVEVLFTIDALHDGVRHMWFNEGVEGYSHYPKMTGYSELFTKVREIELERCEHCDR